MGGSWLVLSGEGAGRATERRGAGRATERAQGEAVGLLSFGICCRRNKDNMNYIQYRQTTDTNTRCQMDSLSLI